MGKIRRGGCVFITRVGDHAPRHVHISKGRREIAKYNLDQDKIMEGKLNKKLRKILSALQKEGKL